MSELLTCEGLTKHYGAKTALDGVDLHIGFGKIVGLLGPNGSGKTTLIKLANGLLQPDSGSIRIAGMKPGVESKAIVSYLPDADWLPGWMRVEQLVKMFGDFYKDFDPARANEMLANLELSPKDVLKTLSKGNREKVQLILAMSRNARLGPNGSGKTTLIKLANGLLQPDSGSIRIAGMKPGVESKAIVSYLPDADWLPGWMRVEQLVKMFGDFYKDFDPARANEMLANLELSPKDVLKTLSKGNREKVQLILAMSRNARLYLLDEPIGGVDPAARDYILHTILSNYSKDATVLISTHLIEDIEPVLDEAIFLKEGTVFAHRSVDEIRENEGMSVDAYFREVFKC